MVKPPVDDGPLIAAVATATGCGGVAVIRLSGVDADIISLAVALTAGAQLPPPRQAALRRFYAADGALIDEGLCLYFPAPHSFTGESVLELQGHGGRVVSTLLLQRCLALGARLARPGEFSERAFLHGKLDLAQAEALADLINAGSEAAARSAMRSLTGAFSSAITTLSERLIHLRLLIEAYLDFPEDDLAEPPLASLCAEMAAISGALGDINRRASQGRLLQAGASLVLIGQPNVGKSTLLNALAEDDIAIVADEAGTTRDALCAQINLGGIPLTVIDTAGLRSTSHQVELLGIERTWRAIASADLALVVYDCRYGLSESDRAIIRQLPESLGYLLVGNKCDLLVDDHQASLLEPSDPVIDTRLIGQVLLSAKNGDHLAELKAQILTHMGWQGDDDVFIARSRHLAALAAVGRCCQEADTELHASPAPALELVADALRRAQKNLDSITGEFSADDLLGEIFSHFCIGK